MSKTMPYPSKGHVWKTYDDDDIDREYAFVKHTGFLFSTRNSPKLSPLTNKFLMDEEYADIGIGKGVGSLIAQPDEEGSLVSYNTEKSRRNDDISLTLEDL